MNTALPLDEKTRDANLAAAAASETQTSGMHLPDYGDIFDSAGRYEIALESKERIGVANVLVFANFTLAIPCLGAALFRATPADIVISGVLCAVPVVWGMSLLNTWWLVRRRGYSWLSVEQTYVLHLMEGKRLRNLPTCDDFMTLPGAKPDHLSLIQLLRRLD